MMGGEDSKYPSIGHENLGLVEPRPSTIQEQLKNKRVRLAQQLADIDAAIAAVDSQPGMIDTINALRKVGGF